MKERNQEIQEQKLLEILEIAKQGEKKLKDISDLASDLSRKSEQWYKEEFNQKQQKA